MMYHRSALAIAADQVGACTPLEQEAANYGAVLGGIFVDLSMTCPTPFESADAGRFTIN